MRRVTCLLVLFLAAWLAAPHGFAQDSDGDGILDSADNCIGQSNTDQRDTNFDGYGNLCDADLNNDGVVTVIDFLLLRNVLNTTDADADLNGDGVVTVTDFLLLRNALNQTPGPTGLVAKFPNQQPTANAGPDQTVTTGATVKLDGTGSTEPDGEALSYRWSLASVPAGSAAVLSDDTVIRPTFVADLPGIYFAELVVLDGTVRSTADMIEISTAGSPPVADAGPDQASSVGETVQLDGTGSTDVDGDALTYAWSLRSIPAGSGVALSDPADPEPTIDIDLSGDYIVELIVDDGTATSEPDELIVTTVNGIPLADAGPDGLASVTDVIQLDGTASYDQEGSPLTYQWSLPATPIGSTAALDNPNLAQPSFTVDVGGTYVGQLIVNDGQVNSAPDTATVTTANVYPIAQAGPDQVGFINNAVQLDGSNSSDANTDPLTYQWAILNQPATSVATLVNPTTATPSLTPDVAGRYIVQVAVSDGTSLSKPDTLKVTAVNLNPNDDQDADGLTNQQEADLGTDINEPDTDGDGLDDGDEVNTHGTDPLNIDTDGDSIDDGQEIADGTDPLDETDYLPPDPSLIAPELDAGVASTIGAATEFLYTGPNPIQSGVAPGTIDPVRVVVLRGQVMNRDGSPLPGATISIHNHPEFGATRSRADGMFDLAVNGGGVLTVNYAGDGVLPAQRQVQTPWQDYVIVPDVVLIPLDTKVTTIDLTSGLPMQVATGSPVTDADGTRQAVLMIPQGTTAEITLPNGTTQALSTLNFRATEYTVGDSGPDTMPAPLPPTSGYTYAVELSVDEALASGIKVNGKDVVFNQPVPFYVDNFLNFPVSTAVPVGYYDNDKGAWIPDNNGLVIEIAGITNSVADVDVDGDGLADTGTALSDLNITDAERRQLAVLYSPGKSLWRVQLSHLSTWDYNWPYAPPDDAVQADQSTERGDDSVEQCLDLLAGSIIECQNQVLGERLELTGIPYTLNYRSSRAPGREANRTLRIPLSSDEVPASLVRIELIIDIAGQRHAQTFSAAPDQSTTFVWDGLDAYGRPVAGGQTATVRIGYVYPAIYREPAELAASFAVSGGAEIGGSEARQEITLSQTNRVTLLPWDARAQMLGGWTLDVHHVYDPGAGTLYRGDGSQRSAQASGKVITTIAGNGNFGSDGDNGPATAAQFEFIVSSKVGPDGSIYITDNNVHRIRRVDPGGIITAFAGTGDPGFAGDGGPAISALLNRPRDAAVGPDGSVYIADPGNRRIRRVDPEGIITTFAGNGTTGSGGDGGPATAAQLSGFIDSVAVGPDGSVYIADASNHKVRRVGPDGIITTIAGTGANGFGGSGGLAVATALSFPLDVTVGNDGSIYFTDSDETNTGQIRRVTPDGIIETVFNPGEFSLLRGLAVDRDDNFYFVDLLKDVILKLGTDGRLQTIAGTGTEGFSGDGDFALNTELDAPLRLAVAPDGAIIITDSGNLRVRRIAPIFSGFTGAELAVASKDGSEVFLFDSTGRHQKTLNALTGTELLDFSYDVESRLSQVQDAFGNTTTIEHDPDGNPTAIVGPFGERTALGVDGKGYLNSITDPASAVTAFAYTADGLLVESTDPLNEVSNYTYDSLGRLERAEDRGDGSQDLVRTDGDDSFEVSRTTKLGLTTTHTVEDLADGSELFTTVTPDQLSAQSEVKADGSTVRTDPDGTVVTQFYSADPRFGMQAPVLSSRSLVLPSGDSLEMSATHTVTLLDPSDPFSLTSLTDTSTVGGKTTTSTFDAGTSTITVVSPAGRSSVLTLDTLGRTTRVESPGIADLAITYDAEGRLKQAVNGVGANAAVLSGEYDANGRVAQITDPIGRIVRFFYDAAGNPVETVRPDNASVLFDWDADGNLLAVTPPGRPAWNFSYDARGKLAAVTPPDIPGTGAKVYEYDDDGRLATVTRPDGDLLLFAYDAGDRLESRTLTQGGTAAEVHTLTYDTVSRVATETAPSGLITTYTYDGSLQLSQEWSGPVAGKVSVIYGAGLLAATESVNDEFSVTIQRDDDDLLTAVGDLLITRDAQTGLETGLVIGVVGSTVSHDVFGRVSGYVVDAGATSLYASVITRDAIGHIAERRETIEGGTEQVYLYDYDNLGRLVEVKRDGVVIEDYDYDLNGNRTAATVQSVVRPATYDVQDRLVTGGADGYTYDPNGQLVNVTGSGATTTYEYDGMGMVNAATLADGRVVSYLADFQGRRIGKKVDNVLVQGFLYGAAHRVVAELDGAGAVVSRFVYASGVAPVWMMQGTERYRLVTDGLGNVRLVVDAATGAVVQRLDYDSFGNIVLDTSPGFQPFGFSGGIQDGDTGLVRFGVRDYDPVAGRFTTRDPILFASGSSNAYTYAGNDPINFSDPSGLLACTDSDIVRRSFFDEFMRNHRTTHEVIGNTLENLSGLPPLPFIGLNTLVRIGFIRPVFGAVGVANIRPNSFFRAAFRTGAHIRQGINAVRGAAMLIEAAAAAVALEGGIIIGSAIQSWDARRGRETRREVRRQLNEEARRLGICDCP